MPVSKPLNKGSFYASEGGGDIAMPALDQTPPISQSAPDPWEAQKMQQQQAQSPNPFGPVPDELPQEVRQEMSDFQDRDVSSHPDQEETQQHQTTRDNQSHVEQQPKEDHKNFRAIREAKERAERERDAMLSQMLAMQQQMQLIQQQNQPQQQEQPVEDIDFDIDPDALVEGKHVKKVAAKLKAMEQQMRKYQQVNEGNAVEARIRSQYPDFEKVVSQENVAILRERFPEIAQTLSDTPDIYNKAAAAYSVIKNMGIHKDTAPYENDRAKAVANLQKPRPLTSVSPQQGDSPLSRANAFANGMTDELKEQLRKEMYAARKAM